ncbi:MAG: hypothetical protein HRT67_12235 [Flavobacteriaceae bacterium]|nr:hypothetical protein [Flavobacteriaceae bacterium]
MQRLIPLIVLFLCAFLSSNTNAQSLKKRQPLPLVKYNSNVNKPLTSAETAMLREVYGAALETDILSRPQRLKDIKNILRNRFEIIEISNPRDQKKCTLLSEVALFDAYVKTLKRDVVFDMATFNPLKYNFSFYALGTHMYRVDHTNYFIIIKSQHQR